MGIHATVIINSQARKGQQIQQQLPHWLAQEGITADIRIVTSTSLQSELAAAISSQPPLLIVVGGDGTIATAINLTKGTPTILGLIPAGTTNNLARSLDIPLDPLAALRVITHGSPFTLSLGRIQTGDKWYIFCTAATVGVSAAAIPHTNHRHKRIIGRLAYVLEGTRHFLRHQAFHCKLNVDGHHQSFRTHEVIFANTTHQAGIPLSPEDVKQQPKIALTVLATRHSRLLHLWNFLKLLAGFTRTPSLIHQTTRSLSISVSPAQPLEADGEAIGFVTDLAITADPEKVSILIPPTEKARS